MNINGHKVPFLKIAVPCWGAFLIAMGFIGHMLYLQDHRPAQPDAVLGYVIESHNHQDIYYVSQADQFITFGLWGLLAVYICGVLIYFGRLGLFKRG